MRRVIRRRRKYNSPEADTTNFVEKELQDKVSLFMLRAILKAGGHRKFIDYNNRILEDDIAYFLGVGEYADLSSDEFTRAEVLDILHSSLEKLEAKSQLTTSKTLQNNITNLSKLMGLNVYEQKILEFVVLINQVEILYETCRLLGHELNSLQAKRALALILDIPLEAVKASFGAHSKFEKSSLISMYKRNTNDLRSKIDTLSDEFIDNIYSLDADIEVMLKDNIRSCEPSKLSFEDYTHIQKDIDILYPYLQNALKTKQTGVNVLLYGLPGTGKTELAKVLSSKLKTKLYEISYADEDDEPIEGSKRLKAYKTAQSILSNKKTLLMYDEAEDVFDSSDSIFSKSRQKDKAWINRVLETNTLPTIWITNNIYSIDNALVRRFDMSIEVPIPKKEQREKIIAKYTKDIVQKETISLLAENEDIAPALLDTASKVVQNLQLQNKDEAFKLILNNTLKAQGYNELKVKVHQELPSNYNPSFINSDVDLSELTQGIKLSANARVCLYGPAGTGKSAFGKYVAQELGKKVILKKVSDLQSKWLGECEKNIANAFEEAKEQDAVLIFDEVDTFLSERENAQASWEVSQVNEMLVQMENFDGVFIATTNLMDNLDKASLRRFDLKMKFDFLKPSQNWEIFCSYAKELKLTPTSSLKYKVSNLRYLTPGDFAAVVRQNRFRPIKNAKDLIERLEHEIAIKNGHYAKKMGFL